MAHNGHLSKCKPQSPSLNLTCTVSSSPGSNQPLFLFSFSYEPYHSNLRCFHLLFFSLSQRPLKKDILMVAISQLFCFLFFCLIISFFKGTPPIIVSIMFCFRFLCVHKHTHTQTHTCVFVCMPVYTDI